MLAELLTYIARLPQLAMHTPADALSFFQDTPDSGQLPMASCYSVRVQHYAMPS